jgi:hypothetical protein
MATRKTVAVPLPADLVTKLEAVARARRKSLDTVAADLLRRSVGGPAFTPRRGAAHAAAWKAAFAPLTEDEMLSIDGILVGGDES